MRGTPLRALGGIPAKIEEISLNIKDLRVRLALAPVWSHLRV